jgi:AraC family transcriptional regulator, transcriptional activator of pobA
MSARFQPALTFQINCIEALGSGELSSLPHRHAHFEVLFLAGGCGSCEMDTRSYLLSRGSILYIRPGTMHFWDLESGACGFLLSFSRESLPHSLDSSFSVLRNVFDLVPPSETGEIWTEMTELLQKMAREYNKTGLFKSEVLRGLLKIFLIYLSRLSDQQPVFGNSRKNEITAGFFALLEERFKTERQPVIYADALYISSSYLNDTLKMTTGFTTSYHIQQRVLLEAKRLVVYSNQSLKQVASHLGFADDCHFSRYFKKGCGECFMSFRRQRLSGVV